MRSACFVEKITEPGQQLIGSATIGHEYDAVFIQVSAKRYLTQDFQDWLEVIFTRINPETCDAIRIAITTDHRVN